MKKLLAKIRKLLRDRRTRRIITRFVSVTAAIVVFVTTYALVLPAITMESEAYCGIPAHQHDDSCYELQLTCEIPESPGHQHTDACYSTSPVLVCTEEEHEHSVDNGCYDENGELVCGKEEHTHSVDDGCYEEERVLSCDIPESEGHVHNDDCYEKILTCGKEVHTHSTECYVNPATSATSEQAVEASDGGASTGAGSSLSISVDDGIEYGNEAAGTGSTEQSENASTALTTVENAAAGVTADGQYVPKLAPVNFDTVLNKNTGIYYYSVADGETVEDSAQIGYDGWNRVDKNTELGAKDLLRVYLAYSIPAGSLNATNQVSRYRLPGNLHLTDAQVKAINETVNGVAGQYVDMSTLEILDTEKYYAYLGVEAVEGMRTPDQDPTEYTQELAKKTGAGSEYISALVRVENVYDEQTGEYLGQDLVFTWTPYSIEKNTHQYDSDGQPIKAGMEIDGWLTLDFNLSQIDLVETAVDTFDRERVETTVDADAPVDDHSVENDDADGTVEDQSTEEDETGSAATTVETVERREQTADIVFVAEGRDENGNKIHEISTTLTVVEESVVDVQAMDEAQSAEQEKDVQSDTVSEDEAGEAVEDNAFDKGGESNTSETSATDVEEDKTDDAEPTVIMPAMSFSDSIKVRTGKPADIDAGGTVANAADSLPEEAEVTVRVEADEGTFPVGTTMKLAAVDNLDAVAKAVAETVENPTGSSDPAASSEDAEDADKADTTVNDHGVKNNAQNDEQSKETENTENTAEEQTEKSEDAETHETEKSEEIGKEKQEEQKNLKTYGFQAVDITFVDAEGNEVEPAKPVRVALTSETVEQVKKEAENSSVTDPVVVHVDDEGKAEQMDLVAPEEIEPAQGRSEEELLEETEKAAKSDDTDEADKASTVEIDSTASSDTAVNDDAASAATVDKSESREGSDASENDYTVNDHAVNIDVDTTDTADADAQANTGDGENTGAEKATDDAGDSSTVSFTADSFSVYAIVYTVDFHYDVDGQTYDYSIKGGDVIGLKELLPVLQVISDDTETEVDEVQTFINDIEDVRFSDESLVKVAKIGEDTTAGELKEKIKTETGAVPEYSGEMSEDHIAQINAKKFNAPDWALLSLKSFLSEERLTISMKSGEVWTINVTDEIKNATSNADKGTVFNGRDTKKLDGITINLFDYGPNALDTHANNLQNTVDGGNTHENQGINSGHPLKFYSFGKTPYDITGTPAAVGQTGWSNDPVGINNFSGGTPAVQGIVNGTLNSAGYPQLAGYSGDEGSLQYLFDLNNISGGAKTVYPDVTGLFQVKDGSKLYYDSNQNYARYNNGWFELCNTFYEEGSKDPSDSANYHKFGIGFFPFNDWNYQKDCIHGNENDNSDGNWWCSGHDNSKNGYYNHHFGMTMEASFQMTADGKLNGEDMYFDFSGDDDMWVFIDGKLVLDVGGVHNPVGGRINFNSGAVTVDKAVQVGDYLPVSVTSKNWGDGRQVSLIESSIGGSSTTLSSILGDAWDKTDTQAIHKIQVFYMERGGCYSNLKLEMNLQTLRNGDVEITKKDDQGGILPGATFGLYTDPQCNNPLTIAGTAVTQTSDTTGKVRFVDVPITPAGQDECTYYMKEVSAPSGHKLNTNIYKVVVRNKRNNTPTHISLVTDASGQSVTEVIDERIYGGAVFTKNNGNQQGLPGASFTLYEKDGDLIGAVVKDRSGSNAVVTSQGPGGTVTFANIPCGDYYMKETAAPSGFVLSGDLYEVHIGEDGNAQDPTVIKKKGDANAVTEIANTPVEISIKKTDNQNATLPGAVFTLTKEGESGIDFSPAGSQAKTTFKELSDGTYAITEKTPPAGYKSMTGTIRFKIENGIISEVGTRPSNVDWDGGTFTYVVKNEPDVANNEIKVLKKWVDENGDPVDGTQDVTVQLRRKIKNQHAVNVTLNFAQYTSGGGWWGGGTTQPTRQITLISNTSNSDSATVSWREPDNFAQYGTAPTITINGTSIAGYTDGNKRAINVTGLSDSNWNIQVNYDGNTHSYWWNNFNNLTDRSITISENGGGSGGGSGTTEDTNFPFNSEAETAKATKILKASENYIASWTIGNGNGYDFPISGSGGSYLYYVVELKSGTVLTPGPNGDGLLSISNNDGIATGLITVTNRWTNPTADLDLLKTDGSGNNLAGAVFQLYVDKSTPPAAANYVLVKPESGYVTGYDGIRFNDGTNGAADVELTSIRVNQKPGQSESGVIEYSCFTTSDQTMTLKNLPEGRYRLVEVDAPAGYVLTLKPIEFTVANGVVTYDSTTTNNAGNGNKVTPTPSEGSDVTQLEIANEPGVELPSAGGSGTKLIYLAGALLALFGAAMLMGRKIRA